MSLISLWYFPKPIRVIIFLVKYTLHFQNRSSGIEATFLSCFSNWDLKFHFQNWSLGSEIEPSFTKLKLRLRNQSFLVIIETSFPTCQNNSIWSFDSRNKPLILETKLWFWESSFQSGVQQLGNKAWTLNYFI